MTIKKISTFFFILGLLIIQIFGLRQQAVGAKGKLLCGSKPAVGVKVKLWDEDEGVTDMNGNFSLQGSTKELTTIDPVFKIYHDCDGVVVPGKKKVKLRIPSQYIYAGNTPKKLMNFGILNLETIFEGEERDIY